MPTYFEQYLNHVTRDFVAAGLKLYIENTVMEPFEIKVKRLELSILIDNIINNADKAHAKSLNITMNLQGINELVISFTDDGTMLFSNRISEDVKEFWKDYKLENTILNEKRKKYLAYHRNLMEVIDARA